GTATTPRHLERLFRLSPSIIFCFDGDRAGRAAAWRALETALPELGGGRQISFLFLPDGDDPDSLVRREGVDTFRDLAAKATSLPDFLFEKLAGETDMDRIDGRARLVELAKPLLARLPEGPLRELMHQRLREETGVQSTETPRASKGRQVPSRRSTPSQRLSPIATAISLLLQQPGLATRFALPEHLDDSPDEPGLQLLITLYKMTGGESHLTTAALLERFRDSEDASTLEKLAAKDHLLGEEDFPPFFSETLLTIQEQALGKSIDKLVSRAGQEELDETSKARLAELYRDRQLLRQEREEPGK
ncbi:MAG TPA: DNA primase, partial [Gammaproteobacteria bacterium]|nr:DNA primase [Gammaproteobacteria bacterium]